VTSAALAFGLLPILFPWGRFAFRGTFDQNYRSMLIHGDVVMVACSLLGPALVMLWRRRVPDKVKLPELLGLFGTFITMACVAIFFYASIDSTSNDAANEAVTKVIQDHVVLMTWIITPICFFYALLVAFLDELSSASAMELRNTYNESGKNIRVSIPAGDKQ
jgi:NAD/NADP transhydrogenase beta subunit